ncbi:MAG: cbb3-type cytochrome oxidase assembly protein CcoS [bacterium]|nr:cbb3-type cytochrome oxidase assembly protein CcoS [bacterium]
MEILYLLLPLSLGLALAGVAAFLWAGKNKQFDDLDTPAKRILLDDHNTPKTNTKKPDHTEKEQ